MGGGREVQLHSLITSEYGSEYSASRPDRFEAGKWTSSTQRTEGSVSSTAGMDASVKKIPRPLTGIEELIVHPIR